MFKRVMCITLVMLLVTSSAVFAQSKVKPAVYAGGGLGLPTGPDMFKDYWKMGFGFGGGVGIEFSPGIEVIGKIFYNTFPVDDEKIIDDAGVTGVTIDGLDFRSIEFGADVKYIFMADKPEMKIHPYLTAGLGMANIKFTDATVSGDEGDEVELPFGDYSETKLMFNGGAGVEFAVSPKASIWLDARYTSVQTEGDAIAYLPIRAGVKLLFGE